QHFTFHRNGLYRKTDVEFDFFIWDKLIQYPYFIAIESVSIIDRQRINDVCRSAIHPIVYIALRINEIVIMLIAELKYTMGEKRLYIRNRNIISMISIMLVNELMIELVCVLRIEFAVYGIYLIDKLTVF